MRNGSTDELAPYGYPLDAAPPEALQMLAAELGVPHAGVRAAELRRTLARALADRSLLRGRLLRMSPLCSVALEALIEAGGSLQADPLLDCVVARTGCARHLAGIACDALLERGILLASVRGQRVDRLALPRESGAALYALLAGASLPDSPPPDSPPPDDAPVAAPGRAARDMLAVTALTAHRRVTLTQDGLPNRTTLKRFAKGLGPDAAALEELLVAAMRNGLTGARAERLLPDGRALVRTAQGEPCGSGELARVMPAITGRWSSLEGLARASARVRVHAAGLLFGPGVAMQAEIARLTDLFAQAPGVDVREHDGHTWLRRSPPGPTRGDGHVTPSFEVLLGPAADLTTVARVALGCELVRIDHVLTLRLTAASVTAGLAAGLDKDELRAALEAVGPHGLPANVRVMLDDWTAAARIVDMRRGAFLFTDTETAERIAQSLPDGAVQARPLPGALQLAPWLDHAAIDGALTRAGASLGGITSHAAARHERWVERLPSFEPEDPHALSALPPPNEPDPALRARVLAARRSGDFELTVPPLNVNDALAVFTAKSNRAAPPAVRALVTELEALARRLTPELRSFRNALPRRDREAFETMLALPVPLAPWLALKEKWRRRALKFATTVGELLEASSEFAELESRRSPEGMRLLALLEAPEARKAIADLAARTGAETDDENPELLAQLLDDDLDDDDDDLDGDPYGLSADDRRRILARRPRAGTIAQVPRARLHEIATRAVEDNAVVHVELRQGEQSSVRSLIAEDLRRRGGETVMLGFDLEALEPRVVNVEHVRALVIDGG